LPADFIDRFDDALRAKGLALLKPIA